jgi:hypothetical protein
MSSQLTESQLHELQRTLDLIHKDIRFWPRFRWISLTLAILSFFASVYAFLQVETMREAFMVATETSLDNHKAATLVNSLINVKAQLLRSELQLYVGGAISGILGGTLLVHVLIQWKGNAFQASQAVLLQALLESQVETPNKSFNTDASDAGAG